MNDRDDYYDEAAAQDFDGSTYSREADHDRLSAQFKRVWRAMADESWHTLAELSARLDVPEASLSARLRDFRKPKWGSHEIRRRKIRDTNQWEYRLVVNPLGLDPDDRLPVHVREAPELNPAVTYRVGEDVLVDAGDYGVFAGVVTLVSQDSYRVRNQWGTELTAAASTVHRA